MTTMRKPTGSITEHRDRHGVLRWRVRASVDGKRVSLGLHDSRERAEDILARALETVDSTSTSRAPTVVSWGEKWLARRETDGLHRATAKSGSLWRTHVASAQFADWPLRKVKRTDVVRWVRELLRTEATATVIRGKGSCRETSHKGLGRRLSRQTVVNALALLRRALSDAADEGLVASNVALGVTVPRVARMDEPWAWLRAHEVDALLAVEDMAPAARAVFTVAIFTGLRAGELWGLCWADVHLEGESPELVVRHSYRGPTKAGKVRRVPLLRRAREALEAWRKVAPGIGSALVFPADGERRRDGLSGCHAEGYDAGLPRWLRAAGVERRVRFHDLRHTCAANLVQGTWGREWRLEDVRQMLGHSSITTTERYAHLAPEGIAAAARETDLVRGAR